MFIRTINVIRTKTNLPSFGPPGGTSNVILSIDFINMGTLHAKSSSQFMGVFKSATPDFHLISLYRTRILIQLGHIERSLTVHHIYLTIVIEEEARVIHIFGEMVRFHGPSGFSASQTEK